MTGRGWCAPQERGAGRKTPPRGLETAEKGRFGKRLKGSRERGERAGGGGWRETRGAGGEKEGGQRADGRRRGGKLCVPRPIYTFPIPSSHSHGAYSGKIKSLSPRPWFYGKIAYSARGGLDRPRPVWAKKGQGCWNYPAWTCPHNAPYSALPGSSDARGVSPALALSVAQL